MEEYRGYEINLEEHAKVKAYYVYEDGLWVFTRQKLDDAKEYIDWKLSPDDASGD